jgi:hypothetical protein
MGFFNKLFGEKKSVKENVQPTEDDRNPSYEKQLKSDFGLDYSKGGWGFEGGKIIDDMADQFKDPGICLDILKKVRQKLPFSQICIVGGNMVILVCNTKPNPTCFVSGLGTPSAISSLIALAIKEGGKVTTYRSTWVLTL